VEHKPARCRCFATVTLRLTTLTLKLEGNLDILKMYLHTENGAASLRHLKLELKLKKIRKYVSRSKVKVKCQKLEITYSN